MGKNFFPVEAAGVVVKAAGTDLTLLSGVYFAVRDGEWVAVIGKSGSGKSTLAKTLAGVIQPVAGYVARRELQDDLAAESAGKVENVGTAEKAGSAGMVESVGTAENAGSAGMVESVGTAENAGSAGNAESISTVENAKSVSRTPDGYNPVQLVMQNPEAQAIGETVFEDVCFGLENRGIAPDAMAVIVEEAMAKTGLAGFAGRMTHELSGGQKQLLAIAGAIAAGSPVIVFDEATSMLDPASRERILEVAQELHRQGKAIVWITQLLDELACADRVVVMDEGKIVFDGEPRRFFYDAFVTETGSDEKAGPETGCDLNEKIEPASCCDRYGFERPFAVETARLLIGKGYKLSRMPLTPEELAQAVAEAFQAEGGAS